MLWALREMKTSSFCYFRGSLIGKGVWPAEDELKSFVHSDESVPVLRNSCSMGGRMEDARIYGSPEGLSPPGLLRVSAESHVLHLP